MFKNKSVCIVGYAKYMEKLNLGNYIDSFDEVTRINIGLYPINKDDLGSKTTIGSFSLSLNKIISVINIFNKLCRTQKTYSTLTDICINNNINYIFCLGSTPEYYLKCKNIVDYNNKNINYIIDYNYKTHINEYFFGLTTGLKTIIFLLSCKPKHLYICGFNFSMNIYNDYIKYHNAYKDNNANKNYSNLTYEEWGKDKNWHSTKIEIYLLAKFYKKYNFEVDNILKNLLTNIDYDIYDNNIFNFNFYNIEKKHIYIELFNNLCKFIDNL